MKIVVFCEIEESDKARLRGVMKDAEFCFSPSDEEIAQAQIAIGEIPVDKIPLAKNLRWVQLSFAGTDPYTKTKDLPAEKILPESVVLTNATGAFGLAIAEHMVGCVFLLTKKLHLYRDHMAKGLWQNRGSVDQIEGSTVLVVGLGDLGRSFATKMKALGCYVIGVRRTEREKPSCVDEVYTVDRIDEVLGRADIVALCLPGTYQTEGLMNKDRLARMKNSAILVNTGRGNAVDTDALVTMLEENRLYGVALDVTDPEPLPKDHKLWRMENAMITPHISGKYYLPKTYRNIIGIFEENLRRYQNGEKLKNIVDRETGYCIPQDR